MKLFPIRTDGGVFVDPPSSFLVISGCFRYVGVQLVVDDSNPWPHPSLPLGASFIDIFVQGL